MSKEAEEFATEEDIIICFPCSDNPKIIQEGTKMQDPYTFAQAYADKVNDELFGLLAMALHDDEDSENITCLSVYTRSILDRSLNTLKQLKQLKTK